jgi:hypothetical protein
LPLEIVAVIEEVVSKLDCDFLLVSTALMLVFKFYASKERPKPHCSERGLIHRVESRIFSPSEPSKDKPACCRLGKRMVPEGNEAGRPLDIGRNCVEVFVGRFREIEFVDLIAPSLDQL